ncbi:putative secoisolariciresinol dehydrogenase [Helianthus debilis subsp. tardiflorus]
MILQWSVSDPNLPFKKKVHESFEYYRCRLAGKVALITGAAGGLGECAAKLFAEHGAKIILADIHGDLGQVVCETIGLSNSRYVHCDVSKEEDVKNAVDTAVATYGKLDIMFNNAGTIDPFKASIIDNEKMDFDRVLSVNVTGVFLGMKHAARVMVPSRSGTIISTSSIASNVVGLTKNLAVELGQFGIRVNCLSPYAMFTPMVTNTVNLDRETYENWADSYANLKGVTLTTDDVAKAALFLASDDAKYVSGHNFPVDGGYGVDSKINRFKNEGSL